MNDSAPVLGRIPLLEPSPEIDGGSWPAKAFAGEVIPFSVTAFREGHGLIGVELLLRSPAGGEIVERMLPPSSGTDRWHGLARLDELGEWTFRFRAFADDWATWLDKAGKKVPAGVDLTVTFAEGALLARRAAGEKSRPAAERRRWSELAAALADEARTAEDRLDAASETSFGGFATVRPLGSLHTLSVERSILVERERAGVGGWYEFFPRSVGARKKADGTWKSGTFRTAEARLPEIAAMGFDVVYLPPIHPIGLSGRKGRNNSLAAEPGEPGSPWAIGGADGGHDTIHPELGNATDFRHFLSKAAQAGLEVAIDLALQASPDHPWVHEHPEWFTHLPDGTIAYAENPPKKYQDIYPIDFDNDPDGLYAEVLRIVRQWIGLGVRIFRVDNPHTKPTRFWERLIREVNAEVGDVVFLAEAFTRPAVMNTLAKAGFQQSYSYFTWRNTKPELEEFLTTISTPSIYDRRDDDPVGTAEFLRPNLFVNTPDILTEYLQYGGRPAFKIRAAIAATAAPLWGVYSGFELYESVARPGAEEYIDNEKYEFRPRDFAGAQASGDSLAPYLTMLGRARAEHPALRQLRNLRLHPTEDDAVIAYSKHLPGRFTRTRKADTIIVIANLDPHSVRETLVHLDTEAFGIPHGTSFEVRDLVTGQRWTWRDVDYVRLDAFSEPAHILHVKEAIA